MDEKDAEIELVELHPRGDAILIVCHEFKPPRKWLVSSHVLGVASPYFERLLNSEFKEGKAVQNGECPEIALQEDDPDAMNIILSSLHYKKESTMMTLDLFNSLAIHSDKYKCSQAFHTWVSL